MLSDWGSNSRVSQALRSQFRTQAVQDWRPRVRHSLAGGAGEHLGSQLTGWDLATFSEWKPVCPHMPPPYCDRESESISELHLMSGKYLPSRSVRPHHSWGWLFHVDSAPRVVGPRALSPHRRSEEKDDLTRRKAPPPPCAAGKGRSGIVFTRRWYRR